MNDITVASDTDPQADATRDAFNQAAGAGRSAQNTASALTPPAQAAPTDRAHDNVAPWNSFAHTVDPDAGNKSLKHDFNAAVRDTGRPVEEETDLEQPETPALKLTPPPEYRLPPDLQALNDRLNAKLAIDQEFGVGLRKDRGPDLGL